jgi:hypothetical protein
MPMSLTPSSPPSKPRTSGGSTFDADLYMAQHTGSSIYTTAKHAQNAGSSVLASAGENILLGNGGNDDTFNSSGVGINNMHDFRRQVISKKVLSVQEQNTASKQLPLSSHSGGNNSVKNRSIEFSHNPEI